MRKMGLYLLAGLMGAGAVVHAQGAEAGGRFRALADQYFTEALFHYAPTLATSAGLHEYDGRLENYARSGIDAQIAVYRRYEAKFDSFPEEGLDESTRGDLEMVRGNIHSALLTLE